jgi:hypothetical protein
MKLFSRLLLTLSFLVLVHAAFSQAKRKVEDLSDEEIATFFERAQSSGMTEAQLEKAAKAQGYTSADIAKMRSRLTQIGETKTKEKTTSAKSKTSSKRSVSGKLSTKKKTSKNSEEEDSEDSEMDEEEEIDSTKLPKKIIYGANLFNNKKLNFEPDLRIATPVNYTLGPDDELNIDIFGEAIKNIKGYEDRAIMIRASSEISSNMFLDNSLDFVYIDANHAYDFVKEDIELWYPKVKKGGYLCGHDYIDLDWYNDPHFLENKKDKHIWGEGGKFYHGVFGVNSAVDEFCNENNYIQTITSEWFGTWLIKK